MEERRFVVGTEEITQNAFGFSHPWNPSSEIYGTRLGAMVGLSRTGANRARVLAGKESLIYHSHYREEWTLSSPAAASPRWAGSSRAKPGTSRASRPRGGPPPPQRL